MPLLFKFVNFQKCVNTTEVIRQSNITFFNFTKNIYLNHLPVIIDDATQTWPAMKELTVKKLFRVRFFIFRNSSNYFSNFIQLFIGDPVLAEHDLCYFESNIRNNNQPGGADRLFNDYLNGHRRSFIVQW